MSMLGRKHSAETRAKMSAASKGRPMSEEHRAKLSAALKGRSLPPDAPQRQTGRKLSEETKAKLRGHRHTEEAKKRIGEASKGHVVTADMRARISSKLKGHFVSDETRRKSSEFGKIHGATNFRGGQSAIEFFKILSPAGFIREHHVQWGSGHNERFILDFAHIEGKIDIELDGASHKNTVEYDALRDSVLRSLGWRVIRIKL